MRNNNRASNELRPLELTKNVLENAYGSCYVKCGGTKVLCAATIEESVPAWRKGKGLGWVTAEYSMLPAATSQRTKRERKGAKGRTMEIERLIGRSLRTVCDMSALGGEVTITIDCDVIQADGGTRTASITGAYVALVEALKAWQLAGKIEALPLMGQVAAVSVGMVAGELMLDLDYSEDSHAEVDMNVVMDDKMRFIEVQGTGEQTPFDREKLNGLLDLAQAGIEQLQAAQRACLEG